MKSYFSNHYAKLNNVKPNDPDSIRNWYQARIEYYDIILENLGIDITKKIILEVGSGIGGFLYYLENKRIENFIGVDNSEEQVNVCKTFSSENVMLDNALDFLNNSKSFDLIFAFDFIEHLSKLQIYEFLNKSYSKLNHNGLLILRTPNMSAPFSLFSRYIDFTHEVGFTEFSLIQIVSEYFKYSNVKVFNEKMSIKKKILLKTINYFIEFIYSFPKRKILSTNIYLVAKK